MSMDTLVQRLLCSEGLVDAQRLRRGQLRDDDYPKLARAAGLLGTAPIWIDDSAMLKALAKELGLPVVALSQLSRAPDQRTGDHRPQLSDLRESGAIEQDADVVCFIYRPEMYYGPVDKDGNSIEGIAELIVSKQRNGPTGLVPLYFKKEYTRFDNRWLRDPPPSPAPPTLATPAEAGRGA